MLQDHRPVCNVGVLRPYGWMDEDATWYRDRPWPRRHCVRWGPSSPTERGTAAPPHFLAHAYFVPICCDQTVAHLSNCWALVLFTLCGSNLVFLLHVCCFGVRFSFFSTSQENGSEERLSSDILCRVGLETLACSLIFIGLLLRGWP